MKTAKGLGKGLSALFSETEKDYQNAYRADAHEGAAEVEVKRIYPNPEQPRKIFDPMAMKELEDSIKKHGVITPVVLNKDSDGRYMIVAGERRFRAAKEAGLKTIPAVVKEFDKKQIREIALIENLQREDLNPIEAAMAIKQLMEEYSATQEDIADAIGKARSTITNLLRLLTLNAKVIQLISKNKLSAGHAKALVTLPSEIQLEIANKTVDEQLSVRDTEQLAKEYFVKGELSKKKGNFAHDMSLEMKELINQMQRKFGTKVNVIGNDSKGRIYIDYYSREDLDRIHELLLKIK